MSVCSSQWYSLACLGCVSHVINRKINKRASHIISEKLLSLSYSLRRKWTITAAGETTTEPKELITSLCRNCLQMYTYRASHSGKTNFRLHYTHTRITPEQQLTNITCVIPKLKFNHRRLVQYSQVQTRRRLNILELIMLQLAIHITVNLV